MFSVTLIRWLRPAVAVAMLSTVARAHEHELPPNFTDEIYLQGWNQATGLAWGPDQLLFVWEKSGKVWLVHDGERHEEPLLDISEEVGDWRDLGLLGFALDPDFASNGYFYLLYAVDYHHLRYFGTPLYDPAANEYFHDTIARVTRYTADPTRGFHEIVPFSRQILIGESMSTGLPICHQSHSTGSLVFGADGTLIVSHGDSSSYENVDDGSPQSGSSNTALADGIITLAEDCGAFRSQLVNSHSGKLLRIDPATGDGVPSNPFFDAQNPRAPRSRVWALGLRNPFRFTCRPGTGTIDPGEADPGVLFIGDVGWNAWEEIDVCDAPAQNFGWPLYEGLEAQGNYQGVNELNLDAPNPLFGELNCLLPFLRFGELLVQESGNPSWPNPCNISQQVPAELHRFMHRRPAMDWGRAFDGPARVGVLNDGVAGIVELGHPDCPVAGESFGGTSSTGGVWYTGTLFPKQYQGTYFHADYSGGWIRQFIFDNANRPVEAREFQDHAGAVVALTQGPDGALYYINYDQKGQAAIRRIGYTENAAPQIVAQAEPRYGTLPLTVNFSTDGTTDPEKQPLTYEWDFGDGYTSNDPNPTHTFEDVVDITSTAVVSARIYSLSPPFPQGGGSPSIETIRDNDFPPVGSTDSLRQFDTFHNGDQGDEDWIAYSFGTVQTFRRVIFQEGRQFADGGWFDNFRVQVRSGSTWVDVVNPVFTPEYAGADNESFTTYAISFNAMSGNAIRIYGNPGGSANFISVGEFRVFADNTASGYPRRFDVTLRVTDTLNNFATRTFIVGGNNTPPKVTITSPAPNTLYNPQISFLQPLEAIVSDAEHDASELTCRWDRRLIHDTHSHPEPPDANCSSSVYITPHGDDCESYHWQFALTVTDADGLSTTVMADLFPDCLLCPADLNADSAVDGRDLSVLLGQFGRPVPKGSGADLNADGTVDGADMSVLLFAFGSTCT